MGLLSGAAGAYFTYKFLRILTQDWEDTDAFELGIIDKEGNLLRKVRDFTTSEEKDAYSVFNRLAFNLKRVLNKMPFGKSKLASYGAALYLIKEESGMSDEEMSDVLKELGLPEDVLKPQLSESYIVDSNKNLGPGVYTLEGTIASPITGEVIGKPGHSVIVEETMPHDTVMGIPVYKVKHKLSGQTIYISSEDVRR